MGFPFKTEPTPIQLAALRKAWSKEAYAMFHAMGAGKTKSAIDLAAGRFIKGKIKHVVVVVNPGAVRDVWDVELEKHCPTDYNLFIFEAGQHKALARWEQTRDKDKMNWVVFGIEGFSQGNTDKALEAYITANKHEGIMMVLDESTSIKTATSTRSKKLTKHGRRCDFRLILTGTPITQGYQDLWSQFNFLDPDIIGCKSFVLFRNLYCIMGGFQGKSIIGYQRQEELMERIAPFCDIVTKEEATPELEPKQYLPPIWVEPTPEQKKAMQSLEDMWAAEDGGDLLTISTVMDRITRYQQICGGFFPFDDVENGGYDIKPISGKNPKLDALVAEMKMLHENGEKVIIWARFKPEIELIRDTLNKLWPDSCVDFYGGTPKEERKERSRRFQEDPEVRFIVSSQAVGARGQTWTAATQERYFSQTFSYEDRAQSEDRAHRKGQTKSVGYRDYGIKIMAEKMVLTAVKRKKNLADEFTDGVGKIQLGAKF